MIAQYPEQSGELLDRLTERVRRNADRFAELHRGGGPARVPEEQLPHDVRKTLEALGYISSYDDDDD